jgi:hypothetical protein
VAAYGATLRIHIFIFPDMMYSAHAPPVYPLGDLATADVRRSGLFDGVGAGAPARVGR